MSRDRRSLWKNISTSMKVNTISLKAALVYTWAIPFFDDEGYQDGDPRILKGKIVPLRNEITVNDLKKITQEIAQAGLWVILDVNGSIFIQDPVFDRYQTFHSLHKIPSKIKSVIENHQNSTRVGAEMVKDGCISKEK